MNTNIAAGGNYPDLLSAIYKVEVRNETKISEDDRSFCQNQQDKLYQSLDQIDRWYGIFVEEVSLHKETHKLKYSPNGSLKADKPYERYQDIRKDYSDFEFLPFKSINELVQQNHKAVSAFTYSIVSYFNSKYEVSVPVPSVDSESLPMGFRPVYTTYVDTVIEHLGGRSFRDTAEDELIRRFLKVVSPSRWAKVKPELKGDKISFPNVFNFDSFYFQYNSNKIHYNYHKEIDLFCSGIAFGADDSLTGDKRIICSFNSDDVDISDWYDLATENDIKMKFFKNGRIDVKFENKQLAESCFLKLKLNEVRLQTDDED